MKMKKSMKMRIASKKILSLLLAAAMMLCLLPVSVRAAEGSDFIVTCTSGTYNYQDGVLTLHEGTFSVSMAFGVTTTTDKIVVIPLNSGSIHITLNAVRIDLSGISGECALDIIFPCSVEVTAGYGLSILKSGAGQPGISATGGTDLTINGSGTLEVYAGLPVDSESGAGIGGGIGENGSSNITIDMDGGTLIAVGGVGGAGIGGGSGGAGGTVNIYDGVVTATGHSGGAGIGGGNGGSTNNITIRGGTITATGGENAAGIGGGNGGNATNNITITGGEVIATGGTAGQYGQYVGVGIGGSNICIAPATGVSINVFFGDSYPPTETPDEGNPITSEYAYTSDAQYFHSVQISPPLIFITKQPENTTVICGKSDTLTAEASVTDSSTLEYTWYSCDDMDMTNAVATGTTGETFSIPTTLMPGTYYYFCRVSATGAESVDTCAAMVTVEPQPPELTFMDSDSYDVPAGIVNTAISEINVSGGVSGGTAPYSFSFEPGAPIWLTIDGSTGIITGTRPAAPTDAATAVIRVTDSASVSKTITINVGAVTAPTYSASVSPTSKTFAAATVGFGQQTAQEFTITNTGTGIITGLSAALGGGPASEFEISTALSAASLSSGGTATISVRPKTGLTANTYNDTLTITGSNGISLSVNLSFTVNPATSTDKILISVTTPAAITGVANGTAKTASALGLPGTVTLVTSGGNVSASVSWDVASSSYNISSGNAQTFMVNGTVTLPAGVINPNNAPLSTSISVTVNARSNGGGSPTTPAAPTFKAYMNAGNGTETTLPVTVDKDAGTASIDAGSLVFDKNGTVITMPSIPDVETYTLGIPVANLSTPDNQGSLTLSTDVGSVTVPSNMLTGFAGIIGSKAEISIGQGDKDSLPDDVKSAIGDKPLIRLTLSIDGNQTDWSNPDAPVTVRIPYTPTPDELMNPDSIVVWYIDGSGNPQCIANGHYDPATGTVTFEVTHFSDFAVVYNPVNFNDVKSGVWYYEAVSFIAARGITNGTGGGNFSPDAHLTRGDFLVMLMRTYGIAPDTSPADNFTDAGNTYYTGYLAAAKRLGISSGVGNNMYAPGKEITRQEMFTLLYNALKVIGRLPRGDSGKDLADFSDAGQIASWAKEAMSLLVRTGTVSGNSGKLSPTGTTTRAEMAQVLYNLLGR